MRSIISIDSVASMEIWLTERRIARARKDGMIPVLIHDKYGSTFRMGDFRIAEIGSETYTGRGYARGVRKVRLEKNNKVFKPFLS